MQDRPPGKHDGSGPASVDDRRDALKKLAVGGAIVWAAPAVLQSAAAAATASKCVSTTFTFPAGKTYSNEVNDNPATLATYNPGSIQLRMSQTTYSNTLAGTVPIAGGRNRTTSGGSLVFAQSAINGGLAQTTFTFTSPVFNVAFTITDIDDLNNAWSDRVWLTGAPAFTVSKPTSIAGSGTLTDPLRTTLGSNNLTGGDARGIATFNMVGPVNSFTLNYGCVTPQGGNQLIGVKPIVFCR